ncbi:hydroxymethylbilane synthase [Liberibacter crescens]|nr:hydroxymethylbilane synthase [Liberibacter crescens]AMC12829.1 porphobilinogen deaminase [Liberibacter crescens]
MQTQIFRIGTRSSPLAMAQALETRSRLMIAHHLPETAFEIVPIVTKGDHILHQRFHKAGGKGLFTQEIGEKLLSKELDLAVHSTKDMSAKLLDGLQLAACLPREDVRDVFISHKVKSLQDLPLNGVIGTSSLRRQALLRRVRPDIQIVYFRGQIETRLRKLETGQADATLLAYAGLKRLHKTHVITEILDQETFPPAPGQGAIGIEIRIGDTRVEELVSAINHPETWDAITCERSFFTTLDGSCRTPIAAYASCKDEDISFFGMILTPDGTIFHKIHRNGKRYNAIHIGHEAAEELRFMAGKQFFQFWQ